MSYPLSLLLLGANIAMASQTLLPLKAATLTENASVGETPVK